VYVGTSSEMSRAVTVSPFFKVIADSSKAHLCAWILKLRAGYHPAAPIWAG